MIIGLHDSDGTNFPNLALMKISAWHKQQGDAVEWWNPLLAYDRVYSSKVFTFTPQCEYLPPNTIKGGTGYGILSELNAEVDAMKPDYSIYGGFSKFQPTRPARGVTGDGPLPDLAADISTHTPREGRDSIVRASSPVGCLFQPTRPARGVTVCAPRFFA